MTKSKSRTRAYRAYEHQRKWHSRNTLRGTTARSRARKAWTTLLMTRRDDSESRRIIEESCPSAFRGALWVDPNETDEE